MNARQPLVLWGIACALHLLPFSAALASGDINLAWDDCASPYGAGLNNINPTCTSNNGTNILVASFAPPVDMPQFDGQAGIVDIQTGAAMLGAWWHMEPGGCRAGRITTSFDFTGGPFACTDVWDGGASGAIALGVVNPMRLRVRTVSWIPGFAPILADGPEYYVFKLTISNAQTVGDGSCAGCLDRACFIFNQLLLTQPAGVGDYTITTGPLQQANWRGAIGDDCLQTPTRTKTWGSVKALYR